MYWLCQELKKCQSPSGSALSFPFLNTLIILSQTDGAQNTLSCLTLFRGPGEILHNLMMLRVRGEAGLVLETGDKHAADKVKRPR